MNEEKNIYRPLAYHTKKVRRECYFVIIIAAIIILLAVIGAKENIVKAFVMIFFAILLFAIEGYNLYEDNRRKDVLIEYNECGILVHGVVDSFIEYQQIHDVKVEFARTRFNQLDYGTLIIERYNGRDITVEAIEDLDNVKSQLLKLKYQNEK